MSKGKWVNNYSYISHIYILINTDLNILPFRWNYLSYCPYLVMAGMNSISYKCYRFIISLSAPAVEVVIPLFAISYNLDKPFANGRLLLESPAGFNLWRYFQLPGVVCFHIYDTVCVESYGPYNCRFRVSQERVQLEHLFIRKLFGLGDISHFRMYFTAYARKSVKIGIE